MKKPNAIKRNAETEKWLYPNGSYCVVRSLHRKKSGGASSRVGVLIYVGDTGEKWGYFDTPLLASLGVNVDTHGKMPDVVLHFPERNWLLLVESVTSQHGGQQPKYKLRESAERQTKMAEVAPLS